MLQRGNAWLGGEAHIEAVGVVAGREDFFAVGMIATREGVRECSVAIGDRRRHRTLLHLVAVVPRLSISRISWSNVAVAVAAAVHTAIVLVPVYAQVSLLFWRACGRAAR